MTHPNCDVEVGTHHGPFWVDKETSLMVCQRHKQQYEERVNEFGPYDWEQLHPQPEEN